MLENFADREVGAVSGDLVVESAPGVMAGVGLYWRYEKWLRAREGRVHSTVGATGAISAVRREAVPAGAAWNNPRRCLLAAPGRHAGLPRGPRHTGPRP